jgi:tetratricopeptide (TPR) repeat protein
LESHAAARALELLAQAKQRFEQGDYASAVPLLEQAHALTQSPRYLLNLGIAHHYMNECAVALRYYQLYLEQDPRGEGRAHAANALEHLTPICGARAEPAPSVPAPSSPAPRTPSASSISAAELAGTPTPSQSGVESEPAPESSSRQVLGWALVGTGGVVAGVAVTLAVLSLDAKSDRQALQKSVPPGEKWDDFAGKGQDAELDRKFHRNQVLAWVFSGAAAVLLGAGGGFLLARSEPGVTVSFSTDGAPALEYSTRF